MADEPTVQGREVSPDVGGLRMLARGVGRRCPACGARDTFGRWFTMAPECRSCGLDFDPEPGWVLGAMAVNMIVCTLIAMVLMGVSFALTWPAIAPTVVVVAVFGVAGPLLFYPSSKTTWIAIDLLMDRMEPLTERGRTPRRGSH
jgi:uncharacterized protein (DUF983 family)